MKRPDKFGGPVTYSSYGEMENDYIAGKLHPVDLKQSVANEIDAVVAPVRERFKGTKILEEVAAESSAAARR